MSTNYHQISLNEIFSDCQNKLIDETPSFFQMLSKYVDLDEFIPTEFVSAFYLSTGRTRLYPLQGFLSAFIFQKIFSIPTDSLLLLFLKLCKEIRNFCGFTNQVLSKYIDLDEFIPAEFVSAFYLSSGRTRLYPLQGFLSAFIFQKIISVPTDSLLLLFLKLCKEIRDFCGFTKVPDASLMTRFKQNFEPFIEQMFQKMVDYTEPIRQLIDSTLAQILTFDTSSTANIN